MAVETAREPVIVKLEDDILNVHCSDVQLCAVFHQESNRLRLRAWYDSVNTSKAPNRKCFLCRSASMTAPHGPSQQDLSTGSHDVMVTQYFPLGYRP